MLWLASSLTRADAREEKALLAQLTRKPAAEPLLLRYAELALPCDGRATKAKASELLRRMARANVDWERRIALHAALAEALLAQHAASVSRLGVAILRQDPESAACARQIAALAIRDDALPEATDALVLAGEVLPQDAAIRAELGRLWLARGRLDRALPVFAERFALATGDLGARRDLAYALAADGRPDEALSLLVPAREACEQDATCALTAARIALEGDRFDEALRYLEARLGVEPRDLDALFALGDVHTRARQLDRARTAYARILALKPDSVRAAQALQALAP
ncbi:MAG TPA: tetratricopeptide repeat protein [Polyangiales bacterium]|nr:tetratricopeptide repeat protein [Polyangiales bacterium]